MRSIKNFHSLLVGMQNGTATLEDSLAVSYKTKQTKTIVLQYNQAIMLLGIYSIELKMYVHTETCTQMFTVALLIVAKNWKQRRCPLLSEWINKLWYIHTMEYDSVIKRNKLLSHKKTWGSFNVYC